jgi:hypothetical protein
MRQRCGQPVRGPAAGEEQKFAVSGGLEYASGRILWPTSATKAGAGCVRFLDHLAAALPGGPVVGVLDNGG